MNPALARFVGLVPLTGDQRRSLVQGFTASYGGAHFSKSLIWSSSELLFAYFLTEVCALGAQQMAQILALGLCAGALADLAVGRLIRDRLNSMRAAARLQCLGCVGSVTALVLFSMAGVAPMAMRYPVAIVAGMAFRVAYAFYDIPQNAVLSLVGADSDVRAELSAARTAFSSLATLAISLLAAPVLMGSDSSTSAWRFFILVLMLSASGALGSLGLLLAARNWRKAVAETLESMRPSAFFKRSPIIWKLLPVFGRVALLAGTTSVFMRLETYFAADAFSSNFTRSLVIGAVALGGIASQVFRGVLLRRWSGRAAQRMFALIMAVGAAGFLACANVGSVAAAVTGLIFGFGSCGISMLLWVEIADLVARAPDDSSWSTPATAFSSLTAIIKASLALSTWVASNTLLRAGYGSEGGGDPQLLATAMGVSTLICALVCVVTSRSQAGGESCRYSPCSASACGTLNPRNRRAEDIR